MKKDPHIQRELWKYGIWAKAIISLDKMEDYFEYLYSLLKESDLKRIKLLANRELEACTKEHLDINKKNSKKRRKPTTERFSSIDELRHNLNIEPFEVHNFKSFFADLHRKCGFVYIKFLRSIISCLEEYLKQPVPDSSYSKKLKAIQDTFKLSEKECEMVTFLYLMQCDQKVERLFRSNLGMDEIVKTSALFSRFLRIRPDKLKDYFSRDSRLIKSGILEQDRYGDAPRISNMVVSYLAGLSKLKFINNFVTQANYKNILPLSEHNLRLEQSDLIKNLFLSDNAINILLFGKPGTGKTELSKSLGKALNKKVYFINQKNSLGEEDLAYRKSAILAAINTLDPDNSIIVVDECDEIINTRFNFWNADRTKKDKAWINQLLEESCQKIIWISNSIDGLDNSTKRRFSYSLEFLNLSHKQRVKVWGNQLSAVSINFIDKQQIDTFAKDYKVSAGGIALALQNVASMKSITTKKAKIEALQHLLARHQTFLYGEGDLNPLTETYSLDILNADINLNNVIETAAKFIEYSNGSRTREIANLNLLLKGPPGTGKTEFVKYLAQTLGKELIVKRCSDLLSKWIGETEQQIAQAFKEAEDSDSILFLDEADSLFINRSTAVRSWQVSQTNELLCQMENFKGILVCATNFADNMDSAVMRRFSYKIGFNYLTADAKEALFTKTLGSKLSKPLTDNELIKIRNISSLTPGDFKVVRQKNFFSGQLIASELIQQLELESSYKCKERKIGFATTHTYN